MVVILKSQTSPINPPGLEPVLSIEQVWEVLLIKCRTPEKFIPVMKSTTVLEENEKGLTRKVIFREVAGPTTPPSGKFIEDLTFFKPWKVDFKSRGEFQTFITNLVSQGKDETDLYLTFYFELTYPDIQEGSEEHIKLAQKLSDFPKSVVQETVNVARKLVKDGEVKV